MPLDPSIIMGAGQGVTPLENPLDAMSKAMAFKNLAMQTQQQTQAFNDDQAMRNAWSQNTTVDKDGNPTIDRKGILKSLSTTSPSLVPKMAAQFQATDISNLQAMHEKASMAASTLNGVTDEASYQDAKNSPFAQANGSASWPANYDQSFVSHAMAKSQSVKDYAEQEAKIQGQKIEQQNADTEQVNAGIKAKELGLAVQKPQQESFKDLMSHAESSRQLPSVKQADMDRYTSQKILDLVGKEDPNNLSSSMVTLAGSEAAKLATNGVPDSDALKAIVPHDREMIIAQTKDFMTSHPNASQQGAFVSVLKKYAQTMQTGADKVINNNLGKLGDMYKNHISPTDYQNFKDNVVNGSPFGDKTDPNIVAYAKQYGLDYDHAAKIISSRQSATNGR